MKKIVKILSTIVLILWSVALVLALSFGVGTARKIITTLTNFYNETFNKFEITDVEITNLEESYITNKTFNLEYNVISKKEKDYELIFKSLDEDVFTVTTVGAIKGALFDEKERTGRLEIKSRIDKDFCKVIEIRFYNTFPDEFDVEILDINKQENIYVGIPFYIFPSVKNSSDYTNKKMSIEYDEEIFEKVGSYKYVALKSIESTDFKFKIGDVEVVKTLEIKPQKELVLPDKVELYTKSNIPFQVGKPIYVKFYKNEETAPCNFIIRKSEEKDFSIGTYESITFNNDGDKTIYIDILDNDGNIATTITKNIYVYPKKEEIDLTVIPEEIKIYQYEHAVIGLNLPKKTIIENDKESLKITYSDSNKALNLYDVKIGENTIKLKMTLFNGENIQEVTKEIKIIVLEDRTSKTYVNSKTSKFVTKIMGHMGLFLLEGILAIWFIVFHKRKHKIYDILIYISIGLSVGLLTEFIQIFLEGRNPALKDVGIDFSGYLIGGAIALIIYFVTKAISKKIHKKQESNI